MPLYHFHIMDGFQQEDEEGSELPTIQSARKEALTLAGELLRERANMPDAPTSWQMRVTDDKDLTLFVLEFLLTESDTLSRPERL